jgi:hypothetical protein
MKKNLKNSIVFTIFLLVFASIFYSSCKKDLAEPIVSSDYSNLTAISGLVKNKQGNPIAGVTVTTSGKSTVTDINGAFLITEVTYNDRAFVVGSKSGYFNGSVGIKPKKGEVTMIEMRMIENTPNFNITPTSTQNLDLPNGAGIKINANSVEAIGGGIYTGNLNVAVVHLNPSDPDFTSITPGADLIGTSSSGATRQLLSYGMLMVQLTDNAGNELQLSAGNTSTVTMPVPADMMLNAPATIPLWHFNETSGIWEEEGQATLQGNKYVGTVSHFSTWNCDYPFDRATVKGRILDCNGQPVEGIEVTIGQTRDITDSQGNYERFVPAGLNFNVQVNQPILGIVSSEVLVSSLTNEQTYEVQNINIPCPAYISGTINCSNNSPIIGYGAISWNGKTLIGNIVDEGTFKIAVPANGESATLTIVNSLSGFSETQTVTFPSVAGGTTNVGAFEVCENSDPTNPLGGTLQQSFVINGDGFNNQTISINAISITCFAIYNTTDSVTAGIASGQQGNSITLSFPGNNAGNFNFSSNNNAVFTTTIGANIYVTADNFNINVNQYGNVGQKIKGTFSGDAKRIFYNEVTQTVEEFPVTITNGIFEFQRNPDQN